MGMALRTLQTHSNELQFSAASMPPAPSTRAPTPPRSLLWTGRPPLIQPYVPAAEELATKTRFLSANPSYNKYVRLDFAALASLGPRNFPVTYVALGASNGEMGFMALVGFKHNNMAFVAPVPHSGWSKAHATQADKVYIAALEDVVSLGPAYTGQRNGLIASRLAIEVWQDVLQNRMRVSLVFRREYEHLLTQPMSL